MNPIDITIESITKVSIDDLQVELDQISTKNGTIVWNKDYDSENDQESILLKQKKTKKETNMTIKS